MAALARPSACPVPFSGKAATTSAIAVMRLCDCRCPLHHGYQRTTDTDDSCACAITCATQPMTLLAEQWHCALFLDHAADLWFVNRLPGGQWDWSTAGHIDERHDLHNASVAVQRRLRQIEGHPRQIVRTLTDTAG
jgi:hypothetical protein